MSLTIGNKPVACFRFIYSLMIVVTSQWKEGTCLSVRDALSLLHSAISGLGYDKLIKQCD